MSASARVSVERAIAWIDDAARRLEAEEALPDAASGRVLAADIGALRPIPPCDCAALDGFAVPSHETLGAGAYNPLAVAAIAIEAGEAVPPGMDGVVPLAHADLDDCGRVVMVEPVVPGANIDRRGAVAEAGMRLIAAGTRLAPRHFGPLAAAGVASVAVVRRPCVRLVIAGSVRSGDPSDSNGPMLGAAIARDGGIVAAARLGDAFAEAADLVVIAGGSGPGREDRSAAALSASGTLDIHGVALSPGDTAGFGRTAAGAPVILLPGAPAACFWGYELFAGRAIRRLGGRNPAPPYRSRTMTIARKIVSAIGTTEICPVRRLSDGRIEPVAAFAEIGLMAAVEGDGFVIVPEASEGYPAETTVTAYFYDAFNDAC